MLLAYTIIILSLPSPHVVLERLPPWENHKNHHKNPRHITVLLGALILGVAFADRNEELNEALGLGKQS